ncbi:hypothetical protein VTO42DRAFT_8526 [Malbranchea cinnamomea]
MQSADIIPVIDEAHIPMRRINKRMKSQRASRLLLRGRDEHALVTRALPTVYYLSPTSSRCLFLFPLYLPSAFHRTQLDLEQTSPLVAFSGVLGSLGFSFVPIFNSTR